MDAQTIIISICFVVFFLVAYYIWKSMYELQFRVDSLEQRLGSKSTQNDASKTRSAKIPSSGSSHKNPPVTPETNSSTVQEGGSIPLANTYSSEMFRSDVDNVFMDAPLSIVQRIIGDEHILNPSELLENVGISLSSMVNEGIKDLMMDNEKATFSSFIFTSAPLYTEESEEKRVFEVVNDLEDILDTSNENVTVVEENVNEQVVEENVPVLSDSVNEYKSKTVAELKVICQTHGLATSKSAGQKTKKELVETITQYIEQLKKENVSK